MEAGQKAVEDNFVVGVDNNLNLAYCNFDFASLYFILYFIIYKEIYLNIIIYLFYFIFK
jgi:hypothetical protein